MDLFRLVLCHQPLDRLLDFPVLLRCERFLRVRRSTVNTRGMVPDYIQQCTMEGELCRFSFAHAKCIDLRNRAVFLREVKWYYLFCNKSEEDHDVWYALESGIPEIQARALAYLGTEHADYFLSKFNDLSSVEWTPQLKKEIESILLESGKKGKYDYPERISYLSGYMGIRSNRPASSLNSGKVYDSGLSSGQADAFILKENFDSNPDWLVRRVLDVICDGVHTPGSLATKWSLLHAKGILEIYNTSPKEYLKYMETIEWGTMKVTRSLVLRARVYAENEEFRKIFGETDAMKVYQVLAGYNIEASLPASAIKLLCGVILRSPRDRSFDGNYPSVQQVVAYQTRPISAGDVSGRLSFLLGRVEEFKLSHDHLGVWMQKDFISNCINDPVNIWKVGNPDLIKAAVEYYGWDRASIVCGGEYLASCTRTERILKALTEP